MIKCKLIDAKDKENIYCEMCESTVMFNKKNFYVHLKKEHNMDRKEYYDKFYKTEKDKCRSCQKETKYSQNKYLSFCSSACQAYFNKHLRILSPDFGAKVSAARKYTDNDAATKKRKETCLKKYGVESYSKLPEAAERRNATCIQKYGELKTFKNPSHRLPAAKAIEERYDEINDKRKLFWTEENKSIVLEKRIKTCLERYGVENVFELEATWDTVRKTRELAGEWLAKADQDPYERYRLDVQIETRKWVDELFSKWDGICYYTKKPIMTSEQFLLENKDKTYKDYPDRASIDHKVSVYYGFVNNIPVDVIGNINNLCVCSLKINCMKNYKCEDVFVEEIKTWNK